MSVPMSSTTSVSFHDHDGSNTNGTTHNVGYEPAHSYQQQPHQPSSSSSSQQPLSSSQQRSQEKKRSNYPSYLSSSPGRHDGDPAAGGAQENGSTPGCFRQFFFSPFSGQNWVCVLFNLIILFAWGTFSCVWVATTFGVSAGLFIFWPVGPMLAVLFSLTWRWIAKIETFMNLWIVGFPRQYRLQPVCDESLREAFHGSLCSCSGYWGVVKAAMFVKDVWTSVGYFIFLKAPIVVFLWTWTGFWVCGGLALIFNIVVLAACEVCRDQSFGHGWSHGGDIDWVLTTYKGSAVTIPVGYIMLCIGLMSTRIFTKACSRFGCYVLGTEDPRVEGDGSPLLQIVRHQQNM